jgi:hypothetical protein
VREGPIDQDPDVVSVAVREHLDFDSPAEHVVRRLERLERTVLGKGLHLVGVEVRHAHTAAPTMLATTCRIRTTLPRTHATPTSRSKTTYSTSIRQSSRSSG